MEADADKAENDVSNARAQLAAALELEAGVFQELALVRDSLDAVASSLRLSDESVGGSDGGAKVGVAAAVAAFECQLAACLLLSMRSLRPTQKPQVDPHSNALSQGTAAQPLKSLTYRIMRAVEFIA